MAQYYAKYLSSSGDVVGVLSTSETPQETPDYKFLEIPNPLDDKNIWMVQGGDLVEKQDLPDASKNTIIADGQDSAVILGLPVGTSATIAGPDGRTQYSVDDGLFEISCDISWQLMVTLRCANYKEKIIRITAE